MKSETSLPLAGWKWILSSAVRGFAYIRSIQPDKTCCCFTPRGHQVPRNSLSTSRFMGHTLWPINRSTHTASIASCSVHPVNASDVGPGQYYGAFPLSFVIVGDRVQWFFSKGHLAMTRFRRCVQVHMCSISHRNPYTLGYISFLFHREWGDSHWPLQFRSKPNHYGTNRIRTSQVGFQSFLEGAFSPYMGIRVVGSLFLGKRFWACSWKSGTLPCFHAYRFHTPCVSLSHPYDLNTITVFDGSGFSVCLF